MNNHFTARRFAYVLSFVTLIGAVALPIVSGGVWVFLDHIPTMGDDNSGFSYNPFGVEFDAKFVETPARIAGFCVAVIAAGIQAIGLLAVRATFLEAAQGRALSLRSVVYFRRFAWISLVMVFIGIARESAYSVILSWSNPVGERYVSVTFELKEFSALFVALLFLFVAHVFTAGSMIEKENETFI